MSNLPSYGFGGTNIPVYGLGPGIPVIPLIIPTTGSILGGDSFTILNTGLSALTFQDTFPGSSLSSNWTNISSGGTAVVSNGLTLNVPKTGGLAGIRTNSSYKNFDVSTTLNFDTTIEQLFPSIGFTFLYMRARIDSNNYFSIEFVWDPIRGALINTVICQAGVRTLLTSTSTLNAGTTFRLVRVAGRIQAYAGTNLLIDYQGWRSDTMKIEIATQSSSTPLPLATKITSYMPVMLVTFGNEICPNGGESFGRVVGATPSQDLPENVEVIVYSPTNSVTLGPNSFLYTAPLQLTVSPVGSNLSVFINNDPVLRDSSPTLPGLRLQSG